MNNELKDSITKEDFIINYSKIILLAKLSILYMKNNPPVYGEGFNQEVFYNSLASSDPRIQEGIDVSVEMMELPGYEKFVDEISRVSFSNGSLECSEMNMSQSNEYIEQCYELIQKNSIEFIDNYFM